MNKVTCLLTDYSKTGIGYFLFQKHCWCPTDFPFQKTVLFDLHGKNYIVYADWYTGWIEVAPLLSGKAVAICNLLRSWFCTYGALEEILSDGGPPFDSLEYTLFLEDCGIKKNINHALPIEQGSSWIGHKDRQKNADGLHRWLLSPMPWWHIEIHPIRTLACHQQKCCTVKQWNISSPYFMRSTRFIIFGGRWRSWGKGWWWKDTYWTKSSTICTAAHSKSTRIDHIHGSGQRLEGLLKLWATGRTVYSWTVVAVTLRNCQFLRKILLFVDTADYSPKQPPPQKPRPIDSEPPGDTPELMEVDAMDDDEMMVDNPTRNIKVEENQHLIIHPPASLILQYSTRFTRPSRLLPTQMRGLIHDYSESSRQVTAKLALWS